MNVLVINCGSSSLKFQLINSDTEAVLAKGLCERIGIDGRLNHDFYNTDELESLPQTDYTSWASIKPQIFSMIKGSKTPLSMKIILILSRANTDQLLTNYNLPLSSENINGLFLNIHYDRTNLSCTTGVSYRTFTMDKRLETVFEETILTWLSQNKIAFSKN